jgi:hypothetical protein
MAVSTNDIEALLHRAKRQYGQDSIYYALASGLASTMYQDKKPNDEKILENIYAEIYGFCNFGGDISAPQIIDLAKQYKVSFTSTDIDTPIKRKVAYGRLFVVSGLYKLVTEEEVSMEYKKSNTYS